MYIYMYTFKTATEGFLMYSINRDLVCSIQALVTVVTAHATRPTLRDVHDGHSDAGDEVPNEEAGPVGPHPAEDRDVSEQELQPLLLAARRLQGALQRLRWDHQLPQPVPNRDFGRPEPLFKLGLIQSVSTNVNGVLPV